MSHEKYLVTFELFPLHGLVEWPRWLQFVVVHLQLIDYCRLEMIPTRWEYV